MAEEQPKTKVDKPSLKDRAIHAQTYKRENAKSIKVNSVSKTFPNGVEKTKYIETITYPNGVKKNKLIGVKKNGSQLWGREK